MVSPNGLNSREKSYLYFSLIVLYINIYRKEISE